MNDDDDLTRLRAKSAGGAEMRPTNSSSSPASAATSPSFDGWPRKAAVTRWTNSSSSLASAATSMSCGVSRTQGARTLRTCLRS